jgi:hypothetical protein
MPLPECCEEIHFGYKDPQAPWPSLATFFRILPGTSGRVPANQRRGRSRCFSPANQGWLQTRGGQDQCAAPAAPTQSERSAVHPLLRKPSGSRNSSRPRDTCGRTTFVCRARAGALRALVMPPPVSLRAPAAQTMLVQPNCWCGESIPIHGRYHSVRKSCVRRRNGRATVSAESYPAASRRRSSSAQPLYVVSPEDHWRAPCMPARSPSSPSSLRPKPPRSHQQIVRRAKIGVPVRPSHQTAACSHSIAAPQSPNTRVPPGSVTRVGIPSRHLHFAHCAETASRNSRRTECHWREAPNQGWAFLQESYFFGRSCRRHMICRSGGNSSCFSTEGSPPVC